MVQASKGRVEGMSPAAVAGRVALLALVLLACVLPVLFAASPVTYIPLAAVLLSVGLSYGYLQVLKRALEYSEASLLSSCERGAQVDFVVTFTNRSILPFVSLEPCFYVSDLFGGHDAEMPSSLTLMPRETFDFHFEATFDHIGTYSAGVSRIVISDVFGLFKHTIVNERRHEVQVLPKVFDIHRLDLSNISMRESTELVQAIVTDDMDYAGVRDYTWGDPIKTIHWKLSSRLQEGEYLTRLFENYGNPGIDIILDHSAPSYDAESLMQVFDGVVESALSVGKTAREAGLDATLLYRDRYEQTVRRGVPRTEESMPLVRDIPRITVGEGRSGLDLLRQEVHSIHGEGNIAMCTAHVSDEMVSLLVQAKLHERNPLLFVVVPQALEGRERADFLRPLKRLGAAQIPCYVISSVEQMRG